MKKLLLLATVFLGMTSTINAQALKKGSNFVELNSTSLGFKNVDKKTSVNVGLSGGQFVEDNLAVVGKVGYNSFHIKNYNSNDWSYGVGVKYYAGGVVPLQVDWTGSVGNNYHPSLSFVGLQGGYAWFVSDNFSVEPRIRYDISTKDEYSNIFSGGLGFALHF